MDAIAAGRTNLQAAEDLGIALRSLENTLVKAYKRMSLPVKGRASRTLALRHWIIWRASVDGAVKL